MRFSFRFRKRVIELRIGKKTVLLTVVRFAHALPQAGPFRILSERFGAAFQVGSLDPFRA